MDQHYERKSLLLGRDLPEYGRVVLFTVALALVLATRSWGFEHCCTDCAANCNHNCLDDFKEVSPDDCSYGTCTGADGWPCLSDWNCDGILDKCEIPWGCGVSPNRGICDSACVKDCNCNGIEDKREISQVKCPSIGLCTGNCALDCDCDGVLDECENGGFRVQFLPDCSGCGGTRCVCWTIDQPQLDLQLPATTEMATCDGPPANLPPTEVHLWYSVSGFGDSRATRVPAPSNPPVYVTPDSNGVYKVAIPDDPGFTEGVSQNYFVNYKIGDYAFRSQSVDVNFRTLPSGSPSGERPPVLWWYRWELELENTNVLQNLINSGVVTHLFLVTNRIRYPECDLKDEGSVFRMTVKSIITKCHEAVPPIKVVWARWLWSPKDWGSSPCVSCPDDPDYPGICGCLYNNGVCEDVGCLRDPDCGDPRFVYEDLFDTNGTNIYKEAIDQTLREADLIGADETGLDVEFSGMDRKETCTSNADCDVLEFGTCDTAAGTCVEDPGIACTANVDCAECLCDPEGTCDTAVGTCVEDSAKTCTADIDCGACQGPNTCKWDPMARMLHCVNARSLNTAELDLCAYFGEEPGCGLCGKRAAGDTPGYCDMSAGDIKRFRDAIQRAVGNSTCSTQADCDTAGFGTCVNGQCVVTCATDLECQNAGYESCDPVTFVCAWPKVDYVVPTDFISNWYGGQIQRSKCHGRNMVGALGHRRMTESTYRDGYRRNIVTQDYDILGAWVKPTPEEVGADARWMPHDIMTNHLHLWSSRHGAHSCSASLAEIDVEPDGTVDALSCDAAAIVPVNGLFIYSQDAQKDTMDRLAKQLSAYFNGCADGSKCVNKLCEGNGAACATYCEDGDPCTADKFEPGDFNSDTDITSARIGCTHYPTNCDDGNVCTNDSCSVASGCFYTNNTAVCDDGNACTAGDQCVNGVCEGNVQPDCDSKGQWSDSPVDWPDAQIQHAILLKTGKVLGLAGGSDFFLFDPATNTTRLYTDGPTAHELLDSGHSALPDGRILFAGGGGNSPPEGGTRFNTIYNPEPEPGTWTAVNDSPATRWRPTCTTLGDGTILVTAGWLSSQPDNLANMPTIFDATWPGGGRWIGLSSAEYCPLPPLPDCSSGVLCPDGTPFGGTPENFHISAYPYMFQLSSDSGSYPGDVFYAGSRYSLSCDPNYRMTRVLSTTPTQEGWTEIGEVPIRGSAITTYGPDLVIKGGGIDSGGGTTTGVDRIDMSVAQPGWSATGSMNFARTQCQFITLADGKVLVVGGEWDTDPAVPQAVLEAELYNPGANTWAEMAAMGAPRWEGSVALLLPDGRVLAAGGEALDTNDDQTSKTAQIYSPPYLFDVDGSGNLAVRPTINFVSSAAGRDVIQYGEVFEVRTPEADNVTAVNLIRLGASTRGFDQDQRFVPLGFAPCGTGSGRLMSGGPFDGNKAPPGYYMLFILVNGIPSVATTVQLSEPGTSPPCVGQLSVAVLGSRYLKVTPVGFECPIVLEVIGDCQNPEVLCVTKYVQPDGTLGTSPYCRTANQWGTIIVGGNTDIIPSAGYTITARSCSEGPLAGEASAVTGVWGDVFPPGGSGSGAVDVDDILCMLAGFSGDFTTCTAESLDLTSCVPTVPIVIDLDDILLILSAFSGATYTASCSSPCQQGASGGSSGSGPPSGSTTMAALAGPIPVPDDPVNKIALSASSGSIWEGQTVVVEAIATLIPTQDIRGYQVAVDVSGGTSGTLDLEAANIDITDPDFIFTPEFPFNAYITATDSNGVRLSSALYSGSVTNVMADYLGAFTFRASQGARGTFTISVRLSDSLLRDANSNPVTIDQALSVNVFVDGF